MERQSSLQNASRRGRGHNNGGGNRGLKEQSPLHPGNGNDNKSNDNDNKGAPNQNQQSSHKPVKRNDNNKSNALSGAHNQNQQSSHKPVKHQYRINPNALPDEKLINLSINDPRGDDPTRRITKKANKNGNGRNTESFDPSHQNYSNVPKITCLKLSCNAPVVAPSVVLICPIYRILCPIILLGNSMSDGH